MNRREFTKNKALITIEMCNAGDQPVEDYVKRSTEEQQRLFAIGRKLVDGIWVVVDSAAIVTKNDGVTHTSDHQYAKAADIYFVVTRPDGSVYIDFEFKETKDIALKWHKRWEEMGGKPVIEWDLAHYSGNN